MENVEEINANFERIKELAWKKIKLPTYKGTAETTFTLCDEWAFEAMKYMYLQYDLMRINRVDAEKKVESLRLKYLTNKLSDESRAKAERELQENKKGLSVYTKELIETEGKTVKKRFYILFDKLLPALLDEVTARLIKENTGFPLVTGVLEHTAEEKLELSRIYRIGVEENEE